MKYETKILIVNALNFGDGMGKRHNESTSQKRKTRQYQNMEKTGYRIPVAISMSGNTIFSEKSLD